MTLTFAYEAPINEFQYIPAGSVVEVIENWNEYDGFVAVRYKEVELYFNKEYFVELKVLV